MSLRWLDPRVKLLVLICFSSAALAVRRLTVLIAILVLCIYMVMAGGIRPGAVWKKLRALFGLIVSLFILQCLFYRSGEPLLALRGFTVVTRPGLYTAVLVNLRLLIIMLGALIVLSGETRDYLLALARCKVPYEISFMVLTGLRFIPALREEAQNVLNAAQMRGLRIKKTGLRQKAAAYIGVALPVVAGAVRRAENMSLAMEARGFRAFPRRTNMRSLRMRAEDWVYAVSFCAALAVIIVFF